MTPAWGPTRAFATALPVTALSIGCLAAPAMSPGNPCAQRHEDANLACINPDSDACLRARALEQSCRADEAARQAADDKARESWKPKLKECRSTVSHRRSMS